MSGKQTNSLILKEIKQNSKVEERYEELEKLEIKENFKLITREKRIEEASKPLYLKRYE